jgi:hypothetical protein
MCASPFHRHRPFYYRQNSDGEEMKEGDTLEFRIAYISHATGVVQIDGALV